MAKQWFKKGDKIRQFEVIGSKVNTSIVSKGVVVVNPTLSAFHKAGWQDYTPEPVPPYIPTREEKIHEEIRAKYSDNDELMVLRQYSAGPNNEQYKAAFNEYNAFVEAILAKYPEDNE